MTGWGDGQALGREAMVSGALKVFEGLCLGICLPILSLSKNRSTISGLTRTIKRSRGNRQGLSIINNCVAPRANCLPSEIPLDPPLQKGERKAPLFKGGLGGFPTFTNSGACGCIGLTTRIERPWGNRPGQSHLDCKRPVIPAKAGIRFPYSTCPSTDRPVRQA